MNKRDAKLIAETVTRDQLLAMFERAKVSITDWKEPSKVNPSITLGAAWNIYYPGIIKDLCSMNLPHVKTNVLWVFGEYLDESLKPGKKENQRKPAVDVFHQEPVFDVVPEFKPVLLGYDDCRCILARYCDGYCRPIYSKPEDNNK